MKRNIQDIRDNKFINSFLIAWGLSYWFAVLIKPDLVGNVSPLVSAVSLAILGTLILGNLIIDNTVLWVLLGLFSTSGIISSWVGFTQWTVPYSRGFAAVSMALVNSLSAVVFFVKAMEE